VIMKPRIMVGDGWLLLYGGVVASERPTPGIPRLKDSPELVVVGPGVWRSIPGRRPLQASMSDVDFVGANDQFPFEKELYL
jgi:hypothetical protein